jgi:ATP adenylyltransferase
MQYIEKGDEGTCIFCDRAEAGSDADGLVLKRGGKSFVIMNRYPYTTGHLMVAPYRHVGRLIDLGEVECAEVIGLVRQCEAVLRRALNPDGFNVGVNIGRCAGAGFPGHVHFHVVPRWEGDTNFMPVVSETKVLPETLTDTYRKLVDAWREIEEGCP